MALDHKQFEDVACLGSKVKRLGTSIPVWLYALDDLLVDTGPSTLRSRITPWLQELRPGQAALTHIHEDHSGLASWLQNKVRIPVYLPAGSVDLARHRAKLPFYRWLFWGPRPAFEPSPMPEELVSSGGRRILPISTPGHMEEHVSFFEPEQGRLFSGDLYVRSRPTLGFIDERMDLMIRSLQACLQLDFQTLFCAHAGIVEDGKQALQKKLDYLLELQERKHELEQQGMSLHQMDRFLFPKKPLITFLSCGEWSSRHLLRTL